MSEDAIRKRKEREEKRAAAALAKRIAESGGDSTDIHTISTPPEANSEPIPPASFSNSSLSQIAYTITVPAESDPLAWYSSKGSTYVTIEAAMRAGIWSYPSSAHDRAKCNVFRDMWEKGHYMGVGIKFGGDFLVYPGALSLFPVIEP